MVRRLLVRLHRWLGLGSAAFLLIAAATGTVIAWQDALDGWLNPEFHQARSGLRPALPALELSRRVEQADRCARVVYLPLANAPGVAVPMRVEPRPGCTLAYDDIAVDPATGAVQASRRWGEARLDRRNLLPFIYLLHYSLQIPDSLGARTGIVLMGGVAMVWVVDTLLAFWISFPSRRQWRKSFAFRWRQGGPRLVFDLHRSGALWVYPLLLVLAVTAVAMNLRESVMQPLVAVFSPLAPSPFANRQPASPDAPIEPSISPGEAVRRAGLEAVRLGLRAPPGAIWLSTAYGVWGVALFDSGGERGDGGLGNPWLYLDSRTGAFLAAELPGRGSAGDVFLQAMFPLHSGRIAGLGGRILVSALGALVSSLCVTGVLIWARRRRARAGT